MIKLKLGPCSNHYFKCFIKNLLLDRDTAMFQTLAEIQGQLKQNSLLLQALVGRQTLESCEVPLTAEFNLPLATEEDVKRVEELLTNKGKATLKSLVSGALK